MDGLLELFCHDELRRVFNAELINSILSAGAIAALSALWSMSCAD
jgi:hypothetical protein